MKIPAKGESKYLSKEDLAHPVKATMSVVKQEQVKGDRGNETKYILYFQERFLKPMILNTTNRKRIIAAYGDESDTWAGNVIEIYVDPDVEMGGEIVGGVRVRAAKGSAPTNGHAEVWTLEQAVARLATVGIPREELIAALKAEGKTGWNSARDTPTAIRLVATGSRQEETGFDDSPAQDDQIQF